MKLGSFSWLNDVLQNKQPTPPHAYLVLWEAIVYFSRLTKVCVSFLVQ